MRLKELSKEGEQGRKKITRYTRWLTVALASLQAYGYTVLFTSQGVAHQPDRGHGDPDHHHADLGQHHR